MRKADRGPDRNRGTKDDMRVPGMGDTPTDTRMSPFKVEPFSLPQEDVGDASSRGEPSSRALPFPREEALPPRCPN